MASKPKTEKIVAFIPCYNEEKGIADVIRSFPREKLQQYGYELSVMVIDNNSTDKTAQIARECGAQVVHEPRQGKGHAIRRAMSSIPPECDYIVMLDGDDTYASREIVRMVEPLSSGFSSVVVGSRLGGKIQEGSMAWLNRLGNWIYSHLVRYFYRVNVTDVLTGYFAWSREAALRLRPHLTSEGFAIEMEMITKMARLGEDICSVPISYAPRKGSSSLRPLYDGGRILLMFARNIRWKPLEAPAAPRRVAFVSDSVMPYFNGGKEKRLYEISKRLAGPAREVHIYTMRWWDGPKTIVRDGVMLHALCRYYPLYSGERRSLRQALMFGAATLKLLFVSFDVLDVDHMPFFPLFSARIVTWIKRKKLYGTWHEVWGGEYWAQYAPGLVGRCGALVEWLALRTPDVIVSNSAHTTRRLLNAGVTKEIHTVPLGVDLDDIYTAQAGEERSDVIFVGRLLEHKHADLLVKAIAVVKESLPDITCTIVGDGPQKQSIEKLISSLGLERHVSFARAGTHRELWSLMKASTMLVLPSVREGFGLVAIEAFAAGLPVITTSHPDNAAQDLIIEGVNGFLAEPNEHSIAQKILQIKSGKYILTPNLALEQYDWGSVAKNLEGALA
ncbi:MAG: glycosyltransferase [Patescibacteria group bacterium]|nr:glycosyltransferase [Patescibacteria group bacterium]